MSPGNNVRTYALVFVLLLCAFALLAMHVSPERATHGIAINVCGVTPAIVVAYSDGSIKAFYPPFEHMPPLGDEWQLPISVSSCQGKVTLRPGVDL